MMNYITLLLHYYIGVKFWKFCQTTIRPRENSVNARVLVYLQHDNGTHSQTMSASLVAPPLPIDPTSSGTWETFTRLWWKGNFIYNAFILRCSHGNTGGSGGRIGNTEWRFGMLTRILSSIVAKAMEISMCTR